VEHTLQLCDNGADLIAKDQPIVFLEKYAGFEVSNVSHSWSYAEDTKLCQWLCSAPLGRRLTTLRSFDDIDNTSLPEVTEKNPAQVKLRIQQLLCDRHPARLRQKLGPDVDRTFTCFPMDEKFSSELPQPEPKKVKVKRAAEISPLELTDEQKEILAYNPFDESVPPCILITAAAGTSQRVDIPACRY
jgi:hypothetical protein